MAENNYSAASAAPGGGGGGGEPARGAGGPAKPRVVLRIGSRVPDPEYTVANVPTLSAELAELDAQIAQLTAEIDAATSQHAELEAQIAEKKAVIRVAIQRANKIRPIIRRLQVNSGDESIIPTIDARLAEIDAAIKALKQAKYDEHKNSPKNAYWAQKAYLNKQVHPFELEVERSKLQAQKRRILESKSGVTGPPPFLQYKVDVEYFPETNDRYFSCPPLPEIPEETGDEKNAMLRYLLKKIQEELKKGKHGGVKPYMWNSIDYRDSIHARIGACNLYLQLYAIFQENKQVKVIFSKKHNNARLTKAPGIDGYLMYALGEMPIKTMKKSSKTVKEVIEEIRAIPNTENLLKAGAMHIYNDGIFQLEQFKILKEILNGKGIKMLEKHLYVTRGRHNENVVEVIFSAEPIEAAPVGAASKGGRRKTRRRSRN